MSNIFDREGRGKGPVKAKFLTDEPLEAPRALDSHIVELIERLKELLIDSSISIGWGQADENNRYFLSQIAFGLLTKHYGSRYLTEDQLIDANWLVSLDPKSLIAKLSEEKNGNNALDEIFALLAQIHQDLSEEVVGKFITFGDEEGEITDDLYNFLIATGLHETNYGYTLSDLEDHFKYLHNLTDAKKLELNINSATLRSVLDALSQLLSIHSEKAAE